MRVSTQGRAFVGVTVTCALLGSASAASGRHATTREERVAAIRHARVWTRTDVRAKDLTAGPAGPLAFRAGETLTCTFIVRPHGKGSTRKFDCALPSGRPLKVRYGQSNGEVYAQVAATRLLWALGFGANRMYPVKVACRGCPADPFKDPAPADPSKTTTFDPATIDERTDGTTVETKPDEGWAWRELHDIDESAGGAPRRDRDALTLLAVLVQHSSNKAINQRILCLDAPACTHTHMIMADVGKTFGRASLLNNDVQSSVNFKAWSATPIWKGHTGCVGNLPASLSGTLHDPAIGEGGRRLLSDLLNQLTDAQLRDLFTVARFTQRDPSATVNDWVAAFKAKRLEIAGRTCPSA